jgi:YfiR/HmsC-like
VPFSLQRLVGCVLALALCCVPARGAPPASEYQVKAAYLFNFGQFVEWPPAAFESATAPFVIGIVGDDPFGGILDEMAHGESVDGHPLQIRRFRSAAEIAACNILFIARSQASSLDKTLRGLRGRNVLTVTDSPGDESRDAIIVLINDSNRIRMRINLGAARANNLVISSKLLRPAQVVDGGGSP